MVAASGRWASLLDRRATVLLLLVLTGFRFVAATVSAFAGIQGIDTRGLDAAFEVYSGALVVLLSVLAGVALRDASPPFLRHRGSPLFLGLAVAVVILWANLVVPGLRFLVGDAAPWSDFLLGMVAALAIAALTWVLAEGLAAQGATPRGSAGLRALGLGFAAALLLRSIRLLDVAYVFGWAWPPGLLWTLDFGPSLLLAILAIGAWAQLGLTRPTGMRGRLPLIAVPIAVAALALGAALGVLGGFILANALAWGGSYTVFSPTTVSLTIVGFAIGAYLSLAWTLGRTMPRSVAWPLFGGIVIVALAGIQTSAGTLASLTGVLAGLVVTARGVTNLAARPASTGVRLSSNIV